MLTWRHDGMTAWRHDGMTAWWHYGMTTWLLNQNDFHLPKIKECTIDVWNVFDVQEHCEHWTNSDESCPFYKLRSNSYLSNLYLSNSYYLSNMYLFVTNRNLMAGYKWQCVRRAGPLFTVLSYVIHVTYVNCYALGNNIHTQPLWFSVSKGWSYKTSRFFPSFFAQLPMAIYRKRFKRFTWNLVC